MNPENSTSDNTDYSALIDEYTDDVNDEAVDALEAVHKTVDQAGEAFDESADVGEEVYEILMNVNAGDRMAAVQAALGLLDDQTGKEAREAKDAIEAVGAHAQTALTEVRDLADVLAGGAQEISDGIARIELPIEHLQRK